MKLIGIKETCLYVKDLDVTEDFYSNKLGLECIGKREGSHVFFRVGTDLLLCFNADASKVQTALPRHFGSGELHFAFECEADQYENWKKHITEQGIEIEQEMTWPSGTLSFYFRDPDRHAVEIEMPGLWGF
jgi:catechol 2,3-dioxygenase-like lactoylglutathione lyase family enzyme